jgi:O-succinylhomoserine sulfhydrylase
LKRGVIFLDKKKTMFAIMPNLETPERLLLIQLLQHIVNYPLMKRLAVVVLRMVLVRVSVGLETVKDVIADLEQALS